MAQQSAKLVHREQIADATWAFQLQPENGAMAYKAGQTVDLTFVNPPYNDAEGNARTFSIACAPGGEHLLVATRVRGSAFKRSFLEAPIGLALDLDGPFGSFTLPNRATPVILLAGGIGVTPFRAMVEDAITRKLEHAITLVHSNRTPEEAPFLAELTDWSGSHSKFRYVPTMTQAERAKSPWKGERRRVGPELLGGIAPADRDAPLYYAAGPDRFVKAAVESLKTLGVDEDRIRFEEFPGY